MKKETNALQVIAGAARCPEYSPPMEIEDKRTVYGECLYRLIPSDCEPSVCLMNDWICLPSA